MQTISTSPSEFSPIILFMNDANVMTKLKSWAFFISTYHLVKNFSKNPSDILYFLKVTRQRNIKVDSMHIDVHIYRVNQDKVRNLQHINNATAHPFS